MICGPLCVPKSTYVTLAHKRKQKFFYFGCSLVRRLYCKKSKHKQQNYFRERDGRTDGRTDGQTECNAICGPSYGGGPHNKRGFGAKFLWPDAGLDTEIIRCSSSPKGLVNKWRNVIPFTSAGRGTLWRPHSLLFSSTSATSFFSSTIKYKAWNVLPSFVTDSATVAIFKRHDVSLRGLFVETETL